MPPTLVDSILFGHEKGAFSGASEKNAGKFVEAHGGTIYLDEIGELPLETQVKLLRVVQEGEIDPLGARKSARVDVRIISATDQNLIELVKQGRFREDLYYRLNVFPITMPPLRARRADIPDLARRFLARFSAEEGKKLRGLSAESLAMLSTYDWPGNVRQLENAVFRAVALADGDELTVAEFPQIAAHVEGFDVRVPPAPPPVGCRDTHREIVRIEVRDPNVLRLLDENGDVRQLERLEEETIRFALTHYRGQMSEMARKLGIGRSTLYRKMKDYGLDEADGASTRPEAAPHCGRKAPVNNLRHDAIAQAAPIESKRLHGLIRMALHKGGAPRGAAELPGDRPVFWLERFRHGFAWLGSLASASGGFRLCRPDRGSGGAGRSGAATGRAASGGLPDAVSGLVQGRAALRSRPGKALDQPGAARRLVSRRGRLRPPDSRIARPAPGR